MYKQKFDELWNKTVNAVLYGISAKDIKGKNQINEYLHGIVWDHTWGNKKTVPPERKLLDDISKENLKKAMELESVLSNIAVSNGWGVYAGIIIALAGIITLFATQGFVRIIGGVAGIVGVGIAVVDVLQSNINPQKVASNALAKAKEQCDKILS